MATAIIDREVNRTGDADSSVQRPGRVAGLIAVACVVLGHLPLVITYFQRLLLYDHYQFVPLVLIGVPALFLVRARELPRGVWSRRFPVVPLVVSCFTLLLASLVGSPWAAIVSLLISGGLFLRFYAGPYWRMLRPVWLLLWLVVRPPLHLDLTLITWLQLQTSQVSSMVLEQLGVKHLMDGNVLVIPERRFLVEEACSGIHSVFALLTAAAFYAVCVRATAFRSIVLILSALFWACFMNLIRIAATIFAFEQFQIDLSIGLAHTISGSVTFALAVLFVAFTDQALRFFLDPIDPLAVDFWKQRLNPFVEWWNRDRSQVVGVPESASPARKVPAALTAGGTVVAIGAAVLASGLQVESLRSERQANEPHTAIATLGEAAIPATLGDWTKESFETERRGADSDLGEFSKTWKYRSPSSAMMVSVDFPFRGWHTLTVCYRGQGWIIDDYRTHPLPITAAGERHTFTEVLMHRPSGEHALLLFTIMDRNGRPLDDPNASSAFVNSLRHIVERLKRPLALRFPDLAASQGVTTQLQLLIPSDGRNVPDSIRENARQQFAALQSQISARLQTGGPEAVKDTQP